jgi:hypothetical protein
MDRRTARDEPLRKVAAIFNSLADGFSRITKRDNRQHVQIIRNAERRLYLSQSHEANPIRAHSFRQGRQHHRLDRAASIRNRKRRPLNHHDNCQRCLRDVWAGFANAPSCRRLSRFSTTMKCHGCLFMLLPVNRPASTIRWMVSDGIGLSGNSRIANSVIPLRRLSWLVPFETIQQLLKSYLRLNFL